jgi:flotillin
MDWITIGCVAGAFILLTILFIACYVQAPPSVAYILSGVFKQPRVFIGTGGFKIPFLERLDKVYLGQITVDVNTEDSVPTNDFINVKVDAIAKVRVKPDTDGIRLAGKNFLNMNTQQISSELKGTLQGNMREIVGTLDLKTLNTNREDFSKKVLESAAPDMDKLGIEILSFNIQSITDEKGLIEDLGADNTAAIKKNAAITKANADKEVAIETAKAKKSANDARVEAEQAIAEKNNELAIKMADLKVKEDTKKADADAAYEIQKQEKQKVINSKTVDARIEQTKREQVLADEMVKVTENRLKAEVNKKAEAEKYKTETDASAELEQRKRKAEAEAYEAEQKAKALKAEADAIRYQQEQEALGIKAKAEAHAYEIEQSGIAEAKAIEMKGLAEAEAMEKKAEAFDKYGQAAIVEMMSKILPEVAANVAKPISEIGNMTIYGGDASTVSGNVPAVMKQTMDVLSSVTGVDMTKLVAANTIDAKTNRNIKVDGDPVVQING